VKQQRVAFGLRRPRAQGRRFQGLNHPPVNRLRSTRIGAARGRSRAGTPSATPIAAKEIRERGHSLEVPQSWTVVLSSDGESDLTLRCLTLSFWF